MNAWRALCVFGFLSVAITGNAQTVESRVKLKLQSGKREAAMAILGSMLDEAPPKTHWFPFRRGVTYQQVAKALKGVDGIESFQFDMPELVGVRTGKGMLSKLQAAKQELIERHKDYLSVLREDVRKTTRQRPQRLGWIDAYLWWMERRGMFANDLDYQALYRNALAEAQAMAAPDGLGGRFTEVGPRGVDTPGSGWSGFGPPTISGRVNCVEYAPSNPSIIYAGTAGGGLWKSVDNGVNWTEQSDDWACLNIGAIAIHPTNPNIVYAGTGDVVGSIQASAGVYKTSTGGTAWTRLNGTENWDHVTDIQIDPDDPTTVLIGTAGSISSNGTMYRTTNAGISFSSVGSGQRFIRQQGLFGGSVYTAIAGSIMRRSTDRGATWTPLPVPFSVFGHSDICPSVVNTARSFYINGLNREVWRSDDWGNNWTEITSNLNQGDTWGQASSYNLHVTAGAVDTGSGVVDVVYVGMLDLFRLVLPGTSWTPVGNVYGAGLSARFHTDQHAMAIHPTAENLGIIANDGGVYRISYNGSTGATGVTSLNATIGSIQFYGAAFHPTDKFEYLGGAQDNGTIYSNGLNTEEIVTGGDGIPPVIIQDDPMTQFSRNQRMNQQEDGTFNLRRTMDGWVTKDVTSNAQGTVGEFPFIPVMESPEATPNNVFVLGQGVYRYTISSDTWTSWLGGRDLLGYGVAFAIGDSNPNRLYALSSQKAWMSSNSGSSWVEIDRSASVPATFLNSSISVNPSTSTSILVGNSAYDATPSMRVAEIANTVLPAWVDRSGNLPNTPINDIERDPVDPVNRWWVATDVGVFYTFNRGASYSNFGASNGLPNAIVLELEYVEGQNFLYVTTFGRGVWRYGFNETVPPTIVSGRGSTVTGSLTSIQTADTSYYTVRSYGALWPRIADRGTLSAIVDIGLPVVDPSAVQLTHRFQSTGLRAKINVQIYNYTQSRWETLDTYTGLQTMTTRTSSKDGGLSLKSYVSLLRTMRFRFLGEPSNMKFSGEYLLNLDFVELEVEP